jgi:hypothetical protein
MNAKTQRVSDAEKTKRIHPPLLCASALIVLSAGRRNRSPEKFWRVRKKPLTAKFSTFTFVSQKGGTKRHGQEEESHDQEVFQEDHEEEEVNSSLTPPAWL